MRAKEEFLKLVEQEEFLKPEEEYPPQEFCEENCPSGAYDTLTSFKNLEFYKQLASDGNEEGQKLYLKKIGRLRAGLGCQTCQKALEWEIGGAKREFELLIKS